MPCLLPKSLAGWSKLLVRGSILAEAVGNTWQDENWMDCGVLLCLGWDYMNTTQDRPRIWPFPASPVGLAYGVGEARAGGS